MHEVALSWVIVKVRPETVIVPVRGSGEKFASTVKDTAPLPLPVVPAVV